MAVIKVVAGDIDKGSWQFTGAFGSATMHKASTKNSLWKGETVDFKKQVASMDLLTEEKVKKLAGTAGWGLAGGALLGPLGALGGVLLGGNKKEVAFACYLKDGRKFMATTSNKTWQSILAAKF